MLPVCQSNQEQRKFRGDNCTAREICSTFPNLKRQLKINPQATNSLHPKTPKNYDKKWCVLKLYFAPVLIFYKKPLKVVKSILHTTHGKFWGFTAKSSVVSCLFSLNLSLISSQDVIPDTQTIWYLMNRTALQHLLKLMEQFCLDIIRLFLHIL